jgi:RNA polymerase sigma-70 factor (ECF subfamily)
MGAPALSAILAEARAAWPEVCVPEADFGAYLEGRATGKSPRWSDLYLACGCSRGDPAALKAFEASVVPGVRTALAQMRLDADRIEEALQILRRDLFVADPPKILAYEGDGELRGFARVAATRIALKLARKTKREVLDDEAGRLESAAVDDPELAFLKAKYRAAFRTAVERATADLDDKDALVLRQHFVDDLSIDQIGALHRVHRATAARWVSHAKDSLLAHVRERFMAEANVDASECRSVLKLVESRLDVTLRRHLIRRAGG